MSFNSGKRFDLYKDLLESSGYFKLVCGAGLEERKNVEKLCYIYTLAGCTGFDVAANVDIVSAAKKGIDAAFIKAKDLKLTIPFRPFITVSVGMPGDHHVRKASINSNCIGCNLCIPSCPTNAIPESLNVISELCIGCGNCESACPSTANAIEYNHNAKQLLDVLPKCVEAGAESIELHAGVPDQESTLKEWEIVSNSIPNGMISMCIDRKHLSNNDLVDRIYAAKDIADDRLIIQADGIPMSGGADNFNTTLQAVSIADYIYKEVKLRDSKFTKLPILISGGTNSLTGSLARQCGVKFNGITIGTHARNVISNYTKSPYSLSNSQLLESITTARNLINRNLQKNYSNNI